MDRVVDRSEQGHLTSSERDARRITVRGVVQGVGFRPFIYRLAHEHGVAGWVRNTGWGVEIEIEGRREGLADFVSGIRDEAPPLAHIEALTELHLDPQGYERFEIRHSDGAETDDSAAPFQLVSPDIATCADCLCEIMDPSDRRYRYPFTNCTNCGPRFTIIESLPYDRPSTTMRAFPMCPACQREYDDPLNRRFHAQPNACPICGPQVTLRDGRGETIADGDDAMRTAAGMLREGRILAIKGLGGYQLACDATNALAVDTLRERKRRPHKPFAIMVDSLATAGALAIVGEDEAALLSKASAPIVLLPWRTQTHIATEVAPASTGDRLAVIGIMLPYTPLHHILLRDVGLPLVMTSGNLSEEPIARDNDEALRRLAGIADAFLTHNRGIYSRYDDSVWFVPEGGPQPVRRARGLAPFPIRLPLEARPVLACGAELKNSFCLTRDRYAFLSQHIGDMENAETEDHYLATLALYERLFAIEPELVAVDVHPDYRSTRLGLEMGKPTVRVQHHHAHLVACLADNAVAIDEGEVIGVILDGTGYGLDGRIWGGEVLIGGARGFERAARLEYMPLPGGDAAVRHPHRLAMAYIDTLLGEAALPDTLAKAADLERAMLRRMVARGVNCPWTSAAGRLFDAVSALLGVCGETSYEAQAAIELEAVAGRCQENVAPYPIDMRAIDPLERVGSVDTALDHGWEVGLRPLFAALLTDVATGEGVELMARRFHRTMAQITLDLCRRVRESTGLHRVALSGGCFQNRLLLSMVRPALSEAGFEVLAHRQVPCNDGGIALGQAVVAQFAECLTPDEASTFTEGA